MEVHVEDVFVPRIRLDLDLGVLCSTVDCSSHFSRTCCWRTRLTNPILCSSTRPSSRLRQVGLCFVFRFVSLCVPWMRLLMLFYLSVFVSRLLLEQALLFRLITFEWDLVPIKIKCIQHRRMFIVISRFLWDRISFPLIFWTSLEYRPNIWGRKSYSILVGE